MSKQIRLIRSLFTMCYCSRATTTFLLSLPHHPCSLNREALEEVLQHNSPARLHRRRRLPSKKTHHDAAPATNGGDRVASEVCSSKSEHYIPSTFRFSRAGTTPIRAIRLISQIRIKKTASCSIVSSSANLCGCYSIRIASALSLPHTCAH